MYLIYMLKRISAKDQQLLCWQLGSTGHEEKNKLKPLQHNLSRELSTYFLELYLDNNMFRSYVWNPATH